MHFCCRKLRDTVCSQPRKYVDVLPQLLHPGAMETGSVEMEHHQSFFPFPTCVAQVMNQCLHNVFPPESLTDALCDMFVAAASIAAFDSPSHTIIAFHINAPLLTSCNLTPSFASVCILWFLKLWKYFNIFVLQSLNYITSVSLQSLFLLNEHKIWYPQHLLTSVTSREILSLCLLPFPWQALHDVMFMRNITKFSCDFINLLHQSFYLFIYLFRL